MGFDYSAGHCDTIEPAVIQQVVPTAWAAFHQAVAQVAATFLRSSDSVLADIGREEEQADYVYDCDDEAYTRAVYQQVIPALHDLRKAFTAGTGGIGLNIGWVSDDTFRGSDLNDEVFWYISQHQERTPAYLAFAAIHGEAVSKIWITGG